MDVKTYNKQNNILYGEIIGKSLEKTYIFVYNKNVYAMKGRFTMADNKKMVEAITSMDEDFA